MRIILLSLGTLCLLSTSCAHSSKKMEGRYRLGDPGEGWKQVKAGGADQAWWNAELSATIYSDSNCGDRYEDSSLAALSEHLTFGLTELELVSSQEGSVQGRSSLSRHSRGKLDGVTVDVLTRVHKHNQCIYDLVVVTPPGTMQQVLPAVQRLQDGFTLRGSRS